MESRETVLTILFAGQQRRHRHKEQTLGHGAGAGAGSGREEGGMI